MASQFVSASRHSRIAVSAALVAAGLLWQASPVYAQLDPTLFLKRTTPNIILAVDVANRMERDAPVDPANHQATSNYYDPFKYTRAGSAFESTLGVSGGTFYRRRYGNCSMFMRSMTRRCWRLSQLKAKPSRVLGRLMLRRSKTAFTK